MRLFIPGPIDVPGEILKELARPQLGHRSAQYATLHARVIGKLKKLLRTEGRVFLSASSGSGVWELAARNCVRERAACFGCGAFSEKWGSVCQANGKEVDYYNVEWGKHTPPETVRDALKKGVYDAATVVHNETSTGLTNSLDDIAEVMRGFPDVMFMVDAVSSMGGIPIDVDRLGVDICLASSQKCLGIPPGLAVFSCSEKAMERARKAENRGYYFDLLEFEKRAEKNQTVSTPPIPQIYALDRALDMIFEEGVENRFARHAEMGGIVRAWAKEKFALFPEETYASDTVSCIRNARGMDVKALNKHLLENHDCIISDGYGKLKGQTFRIAHMGEMTPADMRELISWIDEFLARA